MLKRYTTTALAISTAALLTACGGGSGDMDETPMTPAPMPAPEPAETRSVGELLQDGVTLPAHHMIAVKAELGEVVRFKWDQFEVLSVDAHAAVFDVNGLTYRVPLDDDDGFVADNRTVNYNWETSQGEWIAHATLSDVHPDRDAYMTAVKLQSGSPQWRGYAIAGNRSRQLDETRLGTATYTGNVNAHMDVYVAGADRIWSSDYERWGSDHGQLIANFDEGTFSGQLTDWLRRTDDGKVDTDVTATLESAPITADGFSGAIVFIGTDMAGSVDASYEGSFYGPNAETAAGIISGTYTRDGGLSGPMIGQFRANHDD